MSGNRTTARFFPIILIAGQLLSLPSFFWLPSFVTCIRHLEESNGGAADGSGGNGLQLQGPRYYGFYSHRLNSLPATITLALRKGTLAPQQEESPHSLSTPAPRVVFPFDQPVDDRADDGGLSKKVETLRIERLTSLPIAGKETTLNHISGHRSVEIEVYQGDDWLNLDSGLIKNRGLPIGSLVLPGSDQVDASRASKIEVNISAEGLLMVKRTWSYTLWEYTHTPTPPHQRKRLPDNSDRLNALMKFSLEDEVEKIRQEMGWPKMRWVGTSVSGSLQLWNVDDFALVHPGANSSPPYSPAISPGSSSTVHRGKIRYAGLYSRKRKALPYSLGINYGSSGDNLYKLIDVISTHRNKSLPIAGGVPTNWSLSPEYKRNSLAVAVYQGESSNASLNYYLGDCELVGLADLMTPSPAAPVVGGGGISGSGVDGVLVESANEKAVGGISRYTPTTIEITMAVNASGMLTVGMNARQKGVHGNTVGQQCLFQLMNIDIPLNPLDEEEEPDEEIAESPLPADPSSGISVLKDIIGINRFIIGVLVVSVAVLAYYTYSLHRRLSILIVARSQLGPDLLTYSTTCEPQGSSACHYKSSPKGGGEMMVELPLIKPKPL